MSTTTLSTILILLFVFLILATLLGGLIGFLKGLYKTTLKTIIKAVFVTVAVFVSPALANAIGQIDIHNLVGQVQPITIQLYVANLLTQSGAISPINGMSLYETAIALTNSLLAYAAFFFIMVLIQCFSSLLTAIIYNGIFRWFLPVENSKKTKKPNKNKEDLTSGLEDEEGEVLEKPKKIWPLLRIPSAILGAAQEFLCVLLLITPLTSLSQTAVHNKDSILETMKVADVSQDTIDQTDAYIDTVSESVVYNMMAGMGLDMAVMNKASTITLNETQVSLNNLVDSAFDVAEPVLQDGLITYDRATGQVTVQFSALLSVETVTALIERVLENPLFMSLLPSLIDVGLNYASGEAAIAIDELDFSGIDFSSELKIVESVYAKLQDSLIQPMIEGNQFDTEKFCLKTSTLTDEDIETYTEALRELGSLETVKKNMGVILASVGTYLQSLNLSILPTESSAYDGVDWASDLAVIGNVALRFFRDLGVDLTPNLTGREIADKTWELLEDNTRRNNLLTYICGDTSTGFEGLLDTTVFNKLSIPGILSSTLSNISALQSYVSGLDFEEIFSGYQASDYKTEFKTMFSLLNNVYAEDSKISIQNIESIDISDQDTADQLAELLSLSTNSRLFKNLYPKVLKSLLFHNEFDFSKYLFGLTPYNFNYEDEDFIDDFRNILVLLPKIKNLYDQVSDSSLTTAEKIQAFDVDNLVEPLLTIVATSDFFNSDQRTGITSAEQHNVNIHTFLEGLFSASALDAVGLVAPSMDDMQDLTWEDNGDEKGEISLLCSILKDVQANVTFLTSEDRSLADVEDPDTFSDMLTSGLESKLFKPSILSIINDSINTFLEEHGIHVSLDEMRDSLWIEDSERIGEIIKILKELPSGDIDIKTVDPNLLNALITILYQSNFIQMTSVETDPFGADLYHLLAEAGFFSSLGIENLDSDAFTLVNKSETWSDATSSVTIGENTFTVTSKGAIYDLCSLLETLQQDDNFDSFALGQIPDGFADSLSDEVCSSYFLKALFASVFENVVYTIDIQEPYRSALNSLDFTLLKDMDSDTFRAQIKLFERLSVYSREFIGAESKLVYMFTHLFDLSSQRAYPDITDTTDPKYSLTMEDLLDELIDLFAASPLFTTLKRGQNYSPIALISKGIIEETGMSEKVTLVSDENEEEQDLTLQGILASVSDWQVEMSWVKKIINSIQGQTADSFSQKTTTFTAEEAYNFLSDCNASTLYHRLPIDWFETAFEEADMDSMLVDPDTGTVTHPVDFHVHLTSSAEDVAYWDNEIEWALKITMGEDGLVSLFKDTDKSFADLSYTDDSISFSFLAYLANMKLFENSRSYFVLNLLRSMVPTSSDSTSFDILSILQPSSSAPYGENAYAYRFEEIYFSDPKLLNSDGSFNTELGIVSADCLKEALQALMGSVESLASGSSLADLDCDFKEADDACYRTLSQTDYSFLTEESVFFRSSLASEFVADCETALLTNDNFSVTFSGASSLDLFASDYALINTVEGRALNGFVALSKVTESPVSKSTLATIFPLFGTAFGEETSETSLFYSTFQSSYSSVYGNSTIAVSCKSVLGAIPVSKDGETVTLGSIIPELLSADALTASFNSLLTAAEFD